MHHGSYKVIIFAFSQILLSFGFQNQSGKLTALPTHQHSFSIPRFVNFTITIVTANYILFFIQKVTTADVNLPKWLLQETNYISNTPILKSTWLAVNFPS